MVFGSGSEVNLAKTFSVLNSTIEIALQTSLSSFGIKRHTVVPRKSRMMIIKGFFLDLIFASIIRLVIC